MAGSLAKKSLLQLADLRSLPKLSVLTEFLKPGIPLGFCIASAMTLVVSATNLAAGVEGATFPADFCTFSTFPSIMQNQIS